MKRAVLTPARAMKVRTYDELCQMADAFAGGHLNLLILIGRGGLGKTRCLARAVGDGAHWVQANATAFGIYLDAFEYRNQPIVLDDVDGLYRDPKGVRLLKCLCQSDFRKTVSWHTDAKTLDTRGIPKSFSTTSRVAVVANEWTTRDRNVAALEDRAHVIEFDPAPIEIHRQATTWFWDQEVHDFLGEYLHLVKDHSLRTYWLAAERKVAGLDWRKFILSRSLSGTALEVARLKADPSYLREYDRVRAFTAAGHGSRATYYNYARKLDPRRDVPVMPLAHNRSPESPDGRPGVVDLLERQFGLIGNG
jgi:hypothetical protein